MWTVLLAAVALAGEEDPFATDASVHTLDNGLTVILEPSHRTDTVALHLAYGVGSRDEQPGEYGSAHLFEHLMFEGSANAPLNAFDEWLTAAGGSNNAWTSEDLTAYHMTFPSGALDLALFLESDRMAFLDAGLVDENVANQQLVVLQERNQGYAEPNGRDWDALSRMCFNTEHPYHHPVIGSVADIEAFETARVRAFWLKHYRPRNAVLTLVGAFAPEHALARVQHWFGDVPDTGEAPPRQEEAVPAGELAQQHGLLEDDVEQRTVYLIWETVPRRHEDAPALDLLSRVLSWGRGTRLDDALYYDTNLATDEGVYAYHADLSGQFLAYATHHRTPLKKLQKKTLAVVAEVVERPPTEDELDRALRSVRAERLDALEAPWRRAEVLTDCYRDTGSANCGAAEWQRYTDVTTSDLVRVAQTHLMDTEPQTLSVVPPGDGGAIAGATLVELP